MDGKIWLTAATPDGHDFFVLCVDAQTGAILFNEKLFHEDNPEPLGNNVNGYASPSAVAESGRVYIHFGSYGTACLDAANGKVLWERRDLPCSHWRGPASSPFLFEDLIVLTFDGADMQYLTALNKDTGKSVWKTDRSTQWDDLDDNGQMILQGDLRKGYTTPIIVDNDGSPLMISPGSKTGFAYDPRSGREIWHVPYLDSHTAAPRPVFGDGLVYMVSGRGQTKLLALRIDGEGDISDTHVAWQFEGRGLPQEPSPVFDEGLLYILGNNGDVTCMEAATGTIIWVERIGGNYMASPILADGRLYCFSTQGGATVLQTGRTPKVLATSRLESGFLASPAVTGKALILRSKTHLYRIEAK
jgi:outer membrane protein assembly factor BamB